MERVVVWIVAHHDAAGDLAISPGQEQRGVTVLIKRVPLAVEKSFPLNDKRRHPRGIVFVNLPGKFDELIPLGAGTNFDN